MSDSCRAPRCASPPPTAARNSHAPSSTACWRSCGWRRPTRRCCSSSRSPSRRRPRRAATSRRRGRRWWRRCAPPRWRRRPRSTTRLFLGVGKPEIFVYGSYYLSGFLNERPLAQLRDDLQRLGLARDEARGETEDHVAYLFEVMRYLIAGDDAAVCNLEQQRRFFRAQLQPWVEQLCDAVAGAPARAAPGARWPSSRASSCRSRRRPSTCSKQAERQALPIEASSDSSRSPASCWPAAAAAAWAASTRGCRTTTACRWRCMRCCACSRRSAR